MTEIAAPFRAYEGEVRAEWVDYNGHMNDACYAIVLSDAAELLLEWLGLSAAYREQTGAGLYTVETHLRFVHECSLGQALTAASTVVSADAKRLRVWTELYVDGDVLAASADSLYLHVDGESGKVTELPPDRRDRVEQVAAVHASLPRPDNLGKGVGTR